MKLLLYLLFQILFQYQILAQVDSKCQLCFNTANVVKYCSYGLDSSAGKCCLSTGTDKCQKDWFFCSDKAKSSFAFQKYAFCSFDPTICGAQSRNLKAKEVSQTVYTGLTMTTNDVCPYIIVTDSTLTFNVRVTLTIDSAINTDVYLLTGTSIDSISTQQSLKTGSVVSFDSDKIGILILRANFDYPYVQFSYMSEQKISNAGWIGIIVGTSLGYFLILLTAIIFLTRYLAYKRLKEMHSPNIVYFLKKKIVQYTSLRQKDYHEEKPKPKKDTMQDLVYPTRAKAYMPYEPLSPKYVAKPVPPLDLGLNDNFMGQIDQITRLDTQYEHNARPPPTQGPRFAPIAPAPNDYQNEQQEQPKVQIRPYKFDLE